MYGQATALISRDAHAAVENCLLVMGGRTSEVGWFRSRTETYHNDVMTVDFSIGPQWRPQLAEGDTPQPREFHTLSPISGGRLLLLGGKLAVTLQAVTTLGSDRLLTKKQGVSDLPGWVGMQPFQ